MKRLPKRVREAQDILRQLGMPAAQRNERSALCLLALLDISPRKKWEHASSPLIGITPMMMWMQEHYKKEYAPNTRETVRRRTLHPFVEESIAVCNPDRPDRPVNSPKTVYQVEPGLCELVQAFGTEMWEKRLTAWLAQRALLRTRCATQREKTMIPVSTPDGKTLSLSPGDHNRLIRAVIVDFAPRFAPGAELLYVGDTVCKWSHIQEDSLQKLGVHVDSHGKMPDIVLYYGKKGWLLLVEAVTSHGAVNSLRHRQLEQVFRDAICGRVYVTAFPDRSVMSRYVGEIAWQTEVWLADAPDHLIHFNGERFLGPYP